MILLLLLFIPFVTGLVLCLIRNVVVARWIAMASSVVSLGVSFSLFFQSPSTGFALNWIDFLGIQFSLGYDGISLILIILANFLFPFIILSGFIQKSHHPSLLNALILFTQFALAGVFLAQNAFLFYIFWELALIPVFFILLLWGGEGRKKITLKFFIYTLTGSLFLLFGIIFLYHLTPTPHNTEFSTLSQLRIPSGTQIWLFWVLFIAFAIKMPIFPFHTWQPSTYTMAPAQGVMILAGLMTKMGIYGALRFLFPIVPEGVHFWQDTVIVFGIVGVIYSSIIAFRQENLKTLIAFSSMAHISLMAAAMFVFNIYALQGLLLQMIGHGVTIVALLYFAGLFENQVGTLNLSQMGGIKLQAPKMSVVFLIVVLGSISLPLTSGFVSEFLMLTGLFFHSPWIAVLAGLTLILGAVYMLFVYQRIMLGDKIGSAPVFYDLQTQDYIFLIPLVMVILGFGVFPQPVFDLLENSIKSLLAGALQETANLVISNPLNF